MASIIQYMPHYMASEGGLNSNPKDGAANLPANADAPNGVHTSHGMQWRLYRQFAYENGRQPNAAQYLAPSVALLTDFVNWHTWKPLRLNELRHQKVAEHLADHSINAGPTVAVKLMQGLLNGLFGERLAEDGQLGPLTLAAINRQSGTELAAAYAEARRAWYKALNQPYWLQGWLNRVDSLGDTKKKPS